MMSVPGRKMAKPRGNNQRNNNCPCPVMVRKLEGEYRQLILMKTQRKDEYPTVYHG
jgi:hypothetical protein